MNKRASRLMLALAMAGLATLPVVGHAATAVGWQKSLTEAFSAKTSVRAASTGNLVLSGTQTVDGVVLAAGDRVLVKDQAVPAQNGIYIVSAGAWSRATDSDHWGKFIGADVTVSEGTANGRSQWLSTAMAGAGVLDTTSLTFAKLSGATTSSLAALASNGIVVNNGGNIAARSLAAGSSRLSVLNADGVAGNPTLDVVESNIAINNLNGTLSVSKGGTGATSLTTNGVLFGNGTGAIQVTVPGTGGQLLVANASGVPTFVSLTGDASLAASGAVTLANTGVVAGAYGSGTTVPVFSVDAKGRVTSASAVTVTPAWANVTGKPTTVAGYGITDINAYAPTLTGGGASGTWGISITGNAATSSKITSQGNVTAETGTVSPPTGLTMRQVYANGYPVSYGNVMSMGGAGQSQLLLGWSGVSGANEDNFIRSKRDVADATWSPWAKIMTDVNIGNFAPSLTGAGASGTWGISVTGNAATATKLQTARTLSMTGDGSWSVSFDGSGNATAAMTLAGSGVVAGTYGSATTSPVYTVDAKGRITSASNVTITPAWANVTGKPTTLSGYGITDSISVPNGAAVDKSSANLNNLTAAGFYRGSGMVNAPDTGWWYVTVQSHDNTGGNVAGWTLQTATAYGSGNSVPAGTTYTRLQTGSTAWTAWTTSINSANIASYAPSLTGTGASGTWGISISGGIEATQASLGYSVSAVNVDYSSQGGPQVRSQGNGAAMMSFHRPGLYAVNFGLGTDNQLRVGGWSRGASYVVLDSGNFTSYAPSLTGAGASGTWGINITGNAATASSILGFTNSNYSNPVTADGQTQNGVSYVTGVSLYGQTDGALYSQAYNANWVGQIYQDYRTGQLAIRGKNNGVWGAWRQVMDSVNEPYAAAMNQYVRTTDSPTFAAVTASTFNGSLNGNAATASKLATARTISVTGDGSLSFNFDGSTNVGATLTLANSGVTAGTYGNSTTIPVFSVDAKGRVTGVTNTAIAPAWSNISGKPTTIAGFLGTDSVDVANITSRVNSGFYQYSAATQALGWPTNSNGWYHLMSSTHSNTANYYAMQLAADFYNQKLYYRSTNGSGTTAWNEVLHSGNAPYALAMNQYLRTSDGPTFDTVYTGNWFRSNGNSGWYNQSYGGGIWMQDSSWIRTYGSKGFYVQGGSLLVDGVVYASSAIQARGGVSNDSGNLSLSAAGGTVVVNNQMQLAAVASSGAACGVAGAIARDGSNNVFICK